MKLKEFIKKDRRIYALVMTIRGLRDVKVCDAIWGINNNPMMNTLNEYGAMNKGCIIYDLNLNHDSLGFFGLIRWLCGGLIYADRFGYKVCMRVDKNCLYYDPEYSNTENPLEYYFNLSGLIQPEELYQSQNVLRFESKHLKLCDLYYEDRNSVEEYARVWNKYFKLNKTVLEDLNHAMYNLLRNKKTLGVHYRGTDYKMGYKNHPVAVEIEETIQEVKNALSKVDYDSIFVASDEQAAIERFKEEFGELVVSYTDTLRSHDGSAVHTSNYQRKNHKFLLGYEVLRDVITLASCDGLIAGHSNVSAFADVIKTANGQKFEYFKIINKGKNATGKVYRRPN